MGLWIAIQVIVENFVVSVKGQWKQALPLGGNKDYFTIISVKNEAKAWLPRWIFLARNNSFVTKRLYGCFINIVSSLESKIPLVVKRKY